MQNDVRDTGRLGERGRGRGGAHSNAHPLDTRSCGLPLQSPVRALRRAQASGTRGLRGHKKLAAEHTAHPEGSGSDRWRRAPAAGPGRRLAGGVFGLGKGGGGPRLQCGKHEQGGGLRALGTDLRPVSAPSAGDILLGGGGTWEMVVGCSGGGGSWGGVCSGGGRTGGVRGRTQVHCGLGDAQGPLV